MTQTDIRTVLITGANAGIGKEVARQMALRPAIQTIYLACRNEVKARAAKQELERATGKSIFKIVLMDVSDLGSVRSALKSLQEPIDAVVMNAGGMGGKTPLALTKDGVTHMFAANILGHVALLDGLIDSGRLAKGGVGLFVGSEAARGVPAFRMKRPTMATSSVDEFADICTGKGVAGKNNDPGSAYGEIKYVGALWMAATARKHPELRLLTVSPGSTKNTNAPDDFPAPAPVRFLIKRVVLPFVAPLFGMAHSLETGSKRIVDGLTDTSMKNGVFYASKDGGLTGPVVDQSEIFPDLANQVIQDHADEAVHRFV